MTPFEYVRVETVRAALTALAEPGAMAIAGGTDLVDLMRHGIRCPTRLVDINQLPLRDLRLRNRGLRIGALARMSDVAQHQVVRTRFPLLRQALLAGASGQLRNMATIGGNLLQRTRCPYFRRTDTPCNKRTPGSGCSAVQGVQRSHAIFGGSEACIAVHPSDLAVALVTLGATVRVRSQTRERVVRAGDFHRLPDDRPDQDVVLNPGELIVAVDIPEPPHTTRSHYLKVRDRASFEFALVSVAVAIDVVRARIHRARVVLGGVAPKPWRAAAAEQVLEGESPIARVFRLAAEAATHGAHPAPGTAFKVELTKRAVFQALSRANKSP